MKNAYFFQRAAAAFLAIWARLAGLRLAALALPPLRPPRRPKATAAGFLPGSSVAARRMSAAISLKSGLLERFGIVSRPCQRA